jgi:hypothetical protein
MAAPALQPAYKTQRRTCDSLAAAKKSGALSLKTSTYLLPDAPEHYERLQWLAQQVREGGGEATRLGDRH